VNRAVFTLFLKKKIKNKGNRTFRSTLVNPAICLPPRRDWLITVLGVKFCVIRLRLVLCVKSLRDWLN
jgi:hypothetical protein